MKKNFFLTSAQSLLIGALSVLAVVSSCKKKSDDPTPTSGSVKTFTANVTPTTNNGTANVTGAVTTADGNAYLRLVVTSTDNIDHVYITSSNDNGVMTPYFATANYTDSLGNTFKAGTTNGATYTSSNTKSFVLMVPVSVRTSSSAVSDVYTVWFTNGAGNFLKPTKNRVLGPVTFTLNYGTGTTTTFSSATGIQLGDQYASAGSLLVTSGQISALGTSDYDDAPASADLSFSELNNTGTDRTGGLGYNGGAQGTGAMWLISPSLRAAVGYGNEPATGVNITYISAYTGSVLFDDIKGSDLTNLSVGTSTKVQVAKDGVYQFLTASGKKGLIKFTSLSAATSSAGGTAIVSVKVLN